MERLINAVLTRGTGNKDNLELKIFGGGLINGALSDIGGKNIEFVREFVLNEGYRLAGEDLGGTFARRVLFKPASGRVFVKRLASKEGEGVVREELAIAGSRRVEPQPGNDIELF
jgi:chemotaxis protein CheD